jgi:hypothetical protein
VYSTENEGSAVGSATTGLEKTEFIKVWAAAFPRPQPNPCFTEEARDGAVDTVGRDGVEGTIAGTRAGAIGVALETEVTRRLFISILLVRLF